MHRHPETRTISSTTPNSPLDAYRRPESHPCRSPEAMERLFRAADQFRQRK